jgi:Zinc dependent phospholipase C
LDFPVSPFHMTKIGHATVVDAVFDALPPEVRNNLKKNIMEDSSDDPDQKFKDMIKHHYPPSFKEATKWLKEGKASYNNKDYEHASYCFGVASHYITDTFMAPHCVNHEPSKDHHDFEKAMEKIIPHANLLNGDLKSLMISGVERGQKDWKQWKKSKNDTSILQNEADMAASASLTAIKYTLS